MFNKLYEAIKSIIKKTYIYIIVIFILLFLTLFELPYYINMSGSAINLKNKIQIENSYDVSGSINMTYVGSIKANIPFYLISLINKDWDLVKIEDQLPTNETEEQNDKRNKILLEESRDSAIILAYDKANRTINITKTEVYVTYIFEEANTSLEVGDRIISIDGNNINTRKELKEYVNTKNENDTLNIKVINNNKEYVRTAKVLNIENVKLIGITASEKYDYETDPKVKFKISASESGPSGGLMISLAIYNYLTEYDITKGKKIAGTGTIDIDGNVGEISGIKYKLKGAVKSKCDIFLAPSGENYEEAIKLKKENNYDIQIIEVSTFDEALQKLANN